MQLCFRLIPLCSALVLAGCAGLPSGGPKADVEYAITILHTNDHHGRFWKNRDGEYGMAARKTVVDQIRQEVAAAGGYSLLLDGGDVNTGVPESDLQDAVPDFRGMNLLGYDAMAVGNHEFDKPLNVLRLLKASSTFEGAARYAAWKIERHTGVAVDVTPWRERHPVLAAPGVALHSNAPVTASTT